MTITWYSINFKEQNQRAINQSMYRGLTPIPGSVFADSEIFGFFSRM